jgi:hypothetical protein
VKAPALVAVESGPEAFAPLFVAARAARVHLGWLDLAAPAPLPDDLESAAASGALRAVGAGGGRVVVVKPIVGPPVTRDLLREHFLGCAAVLVRGSAGWPRLEPAPGGFRLRFTERRWREFDAEALLRELARPRHRATRGEP